MRYVPDIIFKYDDSVDYGRRIDSLLDEIITTNTSDDNENNT
jgi:ribosome-binding factor A